MSSDLHPVCPLVFVHVVECIGVGTPGTQEGQRRPDLPPFNLERYLEAFSPKVISHLFNTVAAIIAMESCSFSFYGAE